MNRRHFLRAVAAVPFLPGIRPKPLAPAWAGTAASPPASRVRPGDAAWPSDASWEGLNRAAGGRLLRVQSPLKECLEAPDGAACRDLFKGLRNPFFIGDHPGLTQTSGWVDAWTSAPSAYAVVARRTEDVVAAVDFARDNNLRLVVKGGDHSYQGTSNAPDSLLIWMREMNGIALHDTCVARGCDGRQAPQQAVTVEAGAIWLAAYDAVTTRAGRYVQGGGCTTVGVAGLVQSGGFGSFSKNFGLAAAGLLEAEVVTADGAARIANPCTNPDLFWGLKGGGGGSLGVVTRLTLRTHELPDFFGAVFGRIKAVSDEAFRRLIARIVDFYGSSLFNPHWGEQIVFGPGNAVRIAMVFQGLEQRQAQAIWQPFRAWLAASPQDFSVEPAVIVGTMPARHFWDAEFLRKNYPSLVVADDRPDAPPSNFSWAGDRGQAGQFMHGFRSAWLPASLLRDDQRQHLADALVAGTRHWEISLHFNKGLAGAPAEAVAAARDTAMNPAVLDAFARHLRRQRTSGLPEHPRPRARPRRRAPSRRYHRPGDGRAAEGRAGRGLLCVGKRLLRPRLAEILLGLEPSETGRGEADIRSGGPFLRPPRRGQRGMERRRLHARGRALTSEPGASVAWRAGPLALDCRRFEPGEDRGMDGTVGELLEAEIKVVNLGLESFAADLEAAGVAVVHVDWSPPAGGDPELADLLSKLGA